MSGITDQIQRFNNSSWMESSFIQSLAICLFGISISYWWLSNKIKSKLLEVEERQARNKK